VSRFLLGLVSYASKKVKILCGIVRIIFIFDSHLLFVRKKAKMGKGIMIIFEVRNDEGTKRAIKYLMMEFFLEKKYVCQGKGRRGQDVIHYDSSEVISGFFLSHD